jgi:lipopolysaccharide/colanic/teichoic acid biosynthesis glycosyltransferase
MIKRALDLLGSASLFAISAIPMFVTGCLIAIRMGRPVLFKHVRPGKDEKLFCIYKFRTMTDARGTDGNLLSDAERITALGAFLRKTSLDELPELFNVLKGEMSLVGPRPLLVSYLPYYTARERIRHSVRPGITGWAQVMGRNELAWDRRLEYDVWYVKNRSLLLDLKILLLTAHIVLRHQGVVVDPHSTMKNLDEERTLSGNCIT